MEGIKPKDIIIPIAGLIIAIVISAIGATWMVSRTVGNVETSLVKEIQAVDRDLVKEMWTVENNLEEKIWDFDKGLTEEIQAVDKDLTKEIWAVKEEMQQIKFQLTKIDLSSK